MERRQVLAALSALASETRLDLVRLLVPAGKPGLSAGEIARRLGISASRLSFHLAALEQAGLIASRRESRNVFYAADFAGIGQTFGYLLNDCCLDHPEVRECCRSRREQRAACTGTGSTPPLVLPGVSPVREP
ncbi:metalloregulator ArsR/SmtB family transcription factor [Frigidibacter albus]